MYRYFGFLISALLAITLVIGVMLMTPHVAHAACGGTGCNGLDPHNTGCDSGAYPILVKALIDQHGTNDGTLYIEWSPTCHTNWGRIVMKTNNTDPWCGFISSNQCWGYLGVHMYLLGFSSGGYYNGQETYLPLNQDGPDYCAKGCGGSTIFYGNMYYAPNAEILIHGEAISDWYDTDGNDDYAQACLYTGASWKYSFNKPACP